MGKFSSAHMSLEVKTLLQNLIRIPSVNPAFGTAEQGGEAALTSFLQDFVDRQGWPWLRQTVHPGRDNLVAICQPTQPDGSVLLWEVHQDTVGVRGMRIDPFGAEESEGRIWGRGACDNKGGLAAMLAAAVRAQAMPAGPTIILACTINEEHGFTGARALAQIWARDGADVRPPPQTTGPLRCEVLRQLLPAAVIVAEPTQLQVVVAHKGSLRWRCHTRGLAAHSSQPERGRNAIYLMARVVTAIEAYQQEVLHPRSAAALRVANEEDLCRPGAGQRPTGAGLPSGSSHRQAAPRPSRGQAPPSCGRSTVCVSTVQGGVGINTVPDQATIEIDRRLLPGESPAVAYQELIDYVAEKCHAWTAQADGPGSRSLSDAGTSPPVSLIEHEPPTQQSAGLSGGLNQDLGNRLAAIVQAGGAAGELIGVPYGTDAWVFDKLGWPTVVCGPGSIDQAHTDDEWIAIEQLEQATEVFYRVACGGLSD